MTLRRMTFIALSLVLGAALQLARADWPEFRGPRGDGHAAMPADGKPAGLPLEWSESRNIKWKTEIPNKGWSTPVVMENRIWMTAATPDGHDFFAICVDAASGKILVNQKLFHSDNPEPLGNTVNSYASPSPAIEPGRVYVHFGSYGTACLDSANGNVIWQRNDLPCRHYRGPASSVILFEDTLILTMDGVDVQYTAALDKKTGKTVWKTNRTTNWDDANSTSKYAKDGDLRKGHSTPIIVDASGKLQLLSPGAKAAYSYDPRTGKELWHFIYPESWSATPRPVFGKGLALIINGLGKTELYAVKPDGDGDVTGSHIVWKLSKGVSKTASPIVVNDLFYMIADNGVVTCLEPTTGEPVWSGRLPGSYAASPIYADGRLYFCNQQGKTTVIEPGRALKILATNELEGSFMSSPAVDGKALILRTKTHLYRVETP